MDRCARALTRCSPLLSTGMVAALTPLPVIGVPVKPAGMYLDGMDALLSIVQMPAGIPVATVAIGNAKNAGLLAVRILAAADDDAGAGLRAAMRGYQERLADQARAKGEAVRRRPGRAGFTA